MSYLHHSYAFSGHAGIPIEQPVVCGPPIAQSAMAGPMDGYLLPHSPYDMPKYYAHMPIMEEYEEYTENLSRPRLTKEQVDTLEAQFQAHPKPNSNIKRQLAVQTNLSLPRVANWFQNRRAKAKQQKRQEEFERMQREAKEKDEQAKPKEEQVNLDSNQSCQITRTPRQGQDQDQASTPKQPSGSRDRIQTPISSASRSNHQKTRSEVTREKTFASLQRALDAAVAAREHYPQSDGNVHTDGSDVTLNLRTSNLPPAGSVTQSSLNSAFSEWGNSRDSSIAWTPSQSPEDAFEFGSLNAVQFATEEERLAVPSLESPPNPDMTGTDAFGNIQLSNQSSQGWDNSLHGQVDGLSESHSASKSMYSSLQFSSLQPPTDSISRRASSSEELAESIGNIGISAVRQSHQTMQQPSNRMDGPVWRRPEKELDIAARRKRPRPAAIGTNNPTRALVGPSSMSPTTRLPSFGGAHTLRHAKSSHALGSRYAGVRKISAPQRSPLGFSSFAEAATGSTNVDAKRRLQTSASAGNLAPPTPLTPEDLQHLLPTTPRDNPYNLCAPRPADGQLFSCTQPMQINVASPPATPLPMDLLSQLHFQNLAPPLSAPAQYSSFSEYSPISRGPLSGVSWADINAVPSPDTSSFQSNVQMPRPPHYVYEHEIDPDNQWPFADATSLYGTVRDSTTPQATMVTADDHKVTQFHYHEFPEQHEAHRTVAQQLPPQKRRNYTFNNQTPSDF